MLTSKSAQNQSTLYRDLSPTRSQARSTPRSRVARGATFACTGLMIALYLRTRGPGTDRWLMVVPFLLCVAATGDMVRSMHVRWDLHHGGVLLLLYADMMLLTLIAVWTVWPL